MNLNNLQSVNLRDQLFQRLQNFTTANNDCDSGSGKKSITKHLNSGMMISDAASNRYNSTQASFMNKQQHSHSLRNRYAISKKHTSVFDKSDIQRSDYVQSVMRIQAELKDQKQKNMKSSTFHAHRGGFNRQAESTMANFQENKGRMLYTSQRTKHEQLESGRSI